MISIFKIFPFFNNFREQNIEKYIIEGDEFMENIGEKLKFFVESIIQTLVDNPQEVDIYVSLTTKSIIVQIHTDQSDCGKIIGKKGRTIEALKIIILAMKNTQYPEDSRKISVEVLEDEDSDFSYRKKI